MRVVASQIGLKEKSRISVQFEIPELQFGVVSRWIARKISPEYAPLTNLLNISNSQNPLKGCEIQYMLDTGLLSERQLG